MESTKKADNDLINYLIKVTRKPRSVNNRFLGNNFRIDFCFGSGCRVSLSRFPSRTEDT
jgi:hypothetical protein